MRIFVDDDGRRWEVAIASHGRTSGYLNPRVHRPIAQFACLDTRRPRRYAPLPAGVAGLETLDDGELRRLFSRARVH